MPSFAQPTATVRLSRTCVPAVAAALHGAASPQLRRLRLSNHDIRLSWPEVGIVMPLRQDPVLAALLHG
jgi:hypothetical protein